MPVNLLESEAGSTLALEGIVTAEDTDQFITFLKEQPELLIDMSTCDHLHTAVLQAILILRPHISAMPADPFWSRCITNLKENINENNSAG